jgi:hypothetical protein
VLIQRTSSGRRNPVKTLFREWEAQVGRNGALVVAVLVIPDICINLPGPVRLGTREASRTMQGFVFAALYFGGASRPDSTWERNLEVAAKAYRDPPTVVLSSGMPVNCSPPWLRSHLVPWLLSVANEMIDAGYLRGDVPGVLNWLDATRTEGNVHQLVGLSWDEAINASFAWHEGLSKKRIMGPAPAAKKVIHTWKDGFKLYELTTAEELEVEGSHMGHCVGEWMLEDIRRGAMRILSLRDSKERPKVTVELGTNTETPEWVAVMQAQGPGNSPPSDKHAFRVAAYLLAAIPNIDFFFGEEELASYAECLQVAKKLQAVRIGTKMDLHRPEAREPRWFQGTIWLEARPGKKRPWLVAQKELYNERGVVFRGPSRVLLHERGFSYQEIIETEKRLTAMLRLKFLRGAGLTAHWARAPWGTHEKTIFVENREVLPPTTQEVATFILKARRQKEAWIILEKKIPAYLKALTHRTRRLAPKVCQMILKAAKGVRENTPLDAPEGRLARRLR